MNLVDLLLIVIILLGAFSGYRRGFLAGTIGLLLLVLSFLFAFKAYPYVAAFFERHSTSIGVWTLPLAFLCCYVVARIVLSAILSSIAGGVSRDTHEDAANKLLGIVPGTVNGLINAALVSVLLFATPLSDGLSKKTRESEVANRLTPPVEWIEEKLAPVFDKAIRHTINSLTVAEESKESIKLPFSVKDALVRADLEVKMLVLVNEERAKQGLPPLKTDPDMQQLAREYSRDLLARGYFSHTSPEGKTLGDRMRAAHLRYITAGENLALAPTLSRAHNGLMNSPGHRANILHKAFGRVGIGILDGGRYGLMVTQEFRN
jgi:uncharacterized protein YkwD